MLPTCWNRLELGHQIGNVRADESVEGRQRRGVHLAELGEVAAGVGRRERVAELVHVGEVTRRYLMCAHHLWKKKNQM